MVKNRSAALYLFTNLSAKDLASADLLGQLSHVCTLRIYVHMPL